MQLLPCERCRRHIAVDEAVCPFCAAPSRSAMARRSFTVGRLSRAAVFAGATLAGCHPKEPATQQLVTTAPPDATVTTATRDATVTPPRPDAAVATAPTDAAIASTSPDAAAMSAAAARDAGVDAASIAATAHIHGVVTDGANHQPFYGVSVVVFAQGKGAVATTTTTGGGIYRFDKLEPGNYAVIFRAPGGGNWRDPPRPPTQKVVKLAANADLRVDASIAPAPPRPVDTGPCCKPYGAPPARRRVV